MSLWTLTLPPRTGFFFTAVRVVCYREGLGRRFTEKDCGVSRLEALAVEAQRGRLGGAFRMHKGVRYSGVYRRNGTGLVRWGDETVIGPGEIWVEKRQNCNGESIS